MRTSHPKAEYRLNVLFLAALFPFFFSGCQGELSMSKNPRTITEQSAIAIARSAIEGKITVEQNAPVTVKLVNNEFIVTFGITLPPHVYGPHYAAEVTIDATTGDAPSPAGFPR